ncbi:unnamed protein product [Auanema sp. JU1783]|nr:unnamed protein product [Auanema sp. JU1783]
MKKKSHPKVPLEDNPTPAPHPARGVYGFALYIVSWCLLICYLFWAIVPTPILNRLGITYVPAKYWAIAGPLLFPLGVTSYVCIIFGINIIRFRGYRILDNVEYIEHDFGERAGFQGLPAEEARLELISKLAVK